MLINWRCKNCGKNYRAEYNDSLPIEEIFKLISNHNDNCVVSEVEIGFPVIKRGLERYWILLGKGNLCSIVELSFLPKEGNKFIIVSPNQIKCGCRFWLGLEISVIKIKPVLIEGVKLVWIYEFCAKSGKLKDLIRRKKIWAWA